MTSYNVGVCRTIFLVDLYFDMALKPAAGLITSQAYSDIAFTSIKHSCNAVIESLNDNQAPKYSVVPSLRMLRVKDMRLRSGLEPF